MSSGGISEPKHHLEKLIQVGLCVPTGTYSVLDDDLKLEMNGRGEYQYVGIGPDYDGPWDRLLRASAFGTCAARQNGIAKQLYGGEPAIHYDPVAGYYLATYAGAVSDSDARQSSSSGGLTTWILRELLRLRLIDGVIHMKTGVHSSSLYEYGISTTDAELISDSGTRYYPGELSGALRKAVNSDGRFAVVGIPTFLYEIRLLQALKPELYSRFPYLIGLICGHQKTANYAEYIGWRNGYPPGALRKISFRKKQDNAPANDYLTELCGIVDGIRTVKTVRTATIYGSNWGYGFFKSRFSDFTDDVFNETADIVFGDAWISPYQDDPRGTNVVITRHKRLQQLISNGIERGDLILSPVAVETVKDSQAGLIRQSIDALPYRQKLMLRGKDSDLIAPPRRSNRSLPPQRARIQDLRVALSQQSHDAYLVAKHQANISAFDREMKPLSTRYDRIYRRRRWQAKFSEGPVPLARAVASKIWRQNSR